MRNELLHKKNEYENVRHLVEWAAETYGENTAFSYKPQQNKPEVVKVNYLAFRDDVRGLASELLSRGYANKQCVVVAKLSYEYIVTYYAVLSIGATLVPLDREWTEKDLGDTAFRADAHLLIADCDIKEKAAYIKDAASPMSSISAARKIRSLLSLKKARRSTRKTPMRTIMPPSTLTKCRFSSSLRERRARARVLCFRREISFPTFLP